MVSANLDNHLPFGKAPIRTSSTELFTAWVGLLRSSEYTPTALNIVGETPGTGKSIAAHLYLAEEEQKWQSLDLTCAMLHMMPTKATTLWLLKQNETDLQMGKYLWRKSRPSLRRLRVFLVSASHIAQLRGIPTITLETIRLAVHVMVHQGDPSSNQSREEDVKMSAHPDAPQNNPMQRVLAALEQCQVQLVVVDDADSLNREYLVCLQMLVEKSGCTVLLLAGINMPFQVATRVEGHSSSQSDEEDE